MNISTDCRECQQSIQVQPHIVLAPGALRGGRRVCMICTLKWMEEHKVPNLLEFSPMYVRAHLDPTVKLRLENQDLKQQVERLRVALETAQRENPNNHYK